MQTAVGYFSTLFRNDFVNLLIIQFQMDFLDDCIKFKQIRPLLELLEILGHRHKIDVSFRLGPFDRQIRSLLRQATRFGKELLTALLLLKIC